MSALVWFRDDLRVTDNPALYHACAADEEVRAVYLVCGEWQERHATAPVRNDLVRRHLHVLGQELAALNIPLQVHYVVRASDLAPQLLALSHQYKSNSLWLNAEYPVDESARDREVIQLFRQKGISVHQFHDRVMLAPAQLHNQQGAPYRVFTAFKRQWFQQVTGMDIRPLALPRPRPTEASVAFSPNEVDVAFAPLPQRDLQHHWPAGPDEAHRRLHDFIENRLHDYHQQRDFPAADGSSSLSPYLSLGALSPRQCLTAALNQTEGDWQQPGASAWINEIIWRDFYQHLAAGFPQLSRGQPLLPYTEGFPWRGADTSFELWCHGQTGIPIIDAAMAQLQERGWMHNRLRMICAMFLTKNLQVDWRLGERFFMSHLVDGDFAANNGGWQWSASTGADAAPYFRIFNPVSQSRRFDPDGEFIRRYLPALAGLPAKTIHQPPAVEGYPAPIVDLAESRRDTLELFKSLSRS